MTDLQIMLAFSAFFMEGLKSENYDEIVEAYGLGASGLVDFANEYATTLLMMYKRGRGITKDSVIGVFEYDVCVPFGEWLGDTILVTGRAPTKTECLEKLNDLTLSFFRDNIDEGLFTRPQIQADLDAAFGRVPTPSIEEASAALTGWWKEYESVYETYTGMDRLAKAIKELGRAVAAGRVA